MSPDENAYADVRVLAAELAAFDKYRGALCDLALGKFVLLKGDRLYGVYDGEMEAVGEGYRKFGNVPFLVKLVAVMDSPVWMGPTARL